LTGEESEICFRAFPEQESLMAKSGKTPKRTEKKGPTAKGAPSPSKAGATRQPKAPKEAARAGAKSSAKTGGRTGAGKAPAKQAAAAPVKARHAPAKNPYTKADFDHFRGLLIARRDRILRQVTSMEREALKASDQDFSVDHMADHGSDNYDQDFTLSLVESERRELYEINGALGRIRDGNYGICEGTGVVIGRPRLEAIPYTRYSIEYQRKVEAGEIDEDDLRIEEERERGGEEEE